MQKVVSVEVHSSRILALYLTVIHLLIIIAIDALALPWPLFVLAIVIAFTHWVYALWYHSSVYTGCPVEKIIYRDGRWSLLSCGREIPVTLVRATTWRWLLTMQFVDEHSGGKGYRVVLLPDSCDKEQYRQLQVLLRHAVSF